MPDSGKFDLIDENGKQLDVWEQLSQPQFQRKTGEHFIKGGVAMGNIAAKTTDHERRIKKNETFRERLSTIARFTVKALIVITLVGGVVGIIYKAAVAIAK